MYVEVESATHKIFGDGEGKEAYLDLNAWPFDLQLNGVGIDRVTATQQGGTAGDNPVDAEIVYPGVVKLNFAGPIAVGKYTNIKLTVQLDLDTYDKNA